MSRVNVRRGIDPDLPIDKLRRAIPEQGVEAVVEEPHGARSRIFGVNRHVTKNKHIIRGPTGFEYLGLAFQEPTLINPYWFVLLYLLEGIGAIPSPMES